MLRLKQYHRLAEYILLKNDTRTDQQYQFKEIGALRVVIDRAIEEEMRKLRPGIFSMISQWQQTFTGDKY